MDSSYETRRTVRDCLDYPSRHQFTGCDIKDNYMEQRQVNEYSQFGHRNVDPFRQSRYQVPKKSYSPSDSKSFVTDLLIAANTPYDPILRHSINTCLQEHLLTKLITEGHIPQAIKIVNLPHVDPIILGTKILTLAIEHGKLELVSCILANKNVPLFDGDKIDLFVMALQAKRYDIFGVLFVDTRTTHPIIMNIFRFAIETHHTNVLKIIAYDSRIDLSIFLTIDPSLLRELFDDPEIAARFRGCGYLLKLYSNMTPSILDIIINNLNKTQLLSYKMILGNILKSEKCYHIAHDCLIKHDLLTEIQTESNKTDLVMDGLYIMLLNRVKDNDIIAIQTILSMPGINISQNDNYLLRYAIAHSPSYIVQLLLRYTMQ